MGSEEDPRDYDVSRKQFQVGFIIASVSGALMWLLMFTWVFRYNGGLSWGTDPKTEINLHIVLMIFFVIYLQGHGSLMFRLFPSRPKLQVKLIHAGVHLTTVLAMMIAFWSAIRYHGMKNDPHFYTFHSWIGLTAIILYYGQFLAGFLIFLLPWAPMRIRSLVIPYHKMLGPLIFVSSVIAAATGIMMKALGTVGDRYSSRPADGMVLNFAGFFLLIFAATIVTLVYEFKFRRRARPEGEMLLSDSERSQE